MCVYTYVGRPRGMTDVVSIGPQHARVTVCVGCVCLSVETHSPIMRGWLRIRSEPARMTPPLPARVRMRCRRLYTSRTWFHTRPVDRCTSVFLSVYPKYISSTNVSVIRIRSVAMCTSWRLHTYQHGVYYVNAFPMFICATSNCHLYWSCNVGINFVVAIPPLYDPS